MKCLLVSDLHYAIKQFDWVHHAAVEFDVIVIAGDHLDISSAVAVILKYVQRLNSKARLLVSSGNHDLNAANSDGEKIARWMARVRMLGVATDGDAVPVEDGTLFTVCPWWDGPNTRALVDRQLAADAAKPKSRWIWVYHAPPTTRR